MFSRDQLGPLTLLSGLMTGYQLSSEILENMYHKEDREKFNVIIQDLLKVPSLTLRKNAEKVKQTLEERLEQYLEMNQMYDEMITKLGKEIDDVTQSVQALYRNNKIDPSDFNKVEKSYEIGSADTDDFTRIQARHIGNTSIPTMANIVTQLKIIRQRQEDIDDLKSLGSIKNDFEKFRLLYLYSHSHNYRYLVDIDEEGIVPKLFKPGGISSAASSLQLKGISVEKPRTKLLPIFVGNKSLPFIRTLITLRRVRQNEKLRSATVESLRRIRSAPALGVPFHITAGTPTEMYDLFRNDGKYIDLQTLVVPRSFEVYFQEMHLSSKPPRGLRWDRNVKEEPSGGYVCPSQIIRKEDLTEFIQGRRSQTGTGDGDSKCYVAAPSTTPQWVPKDGYLDSPVDVQDMFDYFATHAIYEIMDFYQDDIQGRLTLDQNSSEKSAVDLDYLNGVQKEHEVLRFLLQERHIMQQMANLIGSADTIKFTKTFRMAQRTVENFNKDTLIKPFPILSTVAEDKSVLKELYCQPKIAAGKKINFMDYHRNPGAQPIYNFGVFAPDFKAKDSDGEERSYFFGENGRPSYRYTETLNNWWSEEEKEMHRANYGDIDITSMTDLGFDFPRIDSETFTKLLESGDDLALFFFRYMHENWQNNFLTMAFPTEDKLNQFADNLTEKNYVSFCEDESLQQNAQTFCEFLVLNTKHEEFIQFYRHYLQTGNCSVANNAEARDYNDSVTSKLNENRGQSEDEILQAYNVPDNEAMHDNKLYRCYKILNVLHALLKDEYEVYRVVNSI